MNFSFIVLICKILSINSTLINYQQFLILNETCIKTWTFFEIFYNISKVTRENFYKSKT